MINALFEYLLFIVALSGKAVIAVHAREKTL